MPFTKTIGMIADSQRSFEDAIRLGVDKAASTLERVRSVWVEDQIVELKDGAVDNYRVRMKVTFELR
jgi:dodecin